MNTIPTHVLLAICGAFLLGSCAETKIIARHNYLFRYQDNQVARVSDQTICDSIYVVKVTQRFSTKLEDKTTYQLLGNKTVPAGSVTVDSIAVGKPLPEKIGLNGSLYSAENDLTQFKRYHRPLVYRDWKFAVQTLTLPLKFRKALGKGTKFPKQVETGFNVGFAPVIKWNWNVYDPIHKRMGKSLIQYSANAGLLLNLGATDLKTGTNAPGLLSDRKAATFSYGTFLMLGINNINFGYAMGWDNVSGEGKDHWVYQHKMWSALIVSLDIIKP